jgi:hypothetical protein
MDDVRLVAVWTLVREPVAIVASTDSRSSDAAAGQNVSPTPAAKPVDNTNAGTDSLSPRRLRPV